MRWQRRQLEGQRQDRRVRHRRHQDVGRAERERLRLGSRSEGHVAQRRHEHTFESWKTGDATKDAVLTDASQRINALDYAIAQGNADEPVLGFYYKGDALVGAAQWVKGFVDAKKSMTGETRYFDPKVDVYSKGRATLTYCSFEGKAYLKDRKTGKAEITPVTSKSYLLYTTRLEKSAKGVWQTAVLHSERGNSACTWPPVAVG